MNKCNYCIAWNIATVVLRNIFGLKREEVTGDWIK
jgi:hypothetical protein